MFIYKKSFTKFNFFDCFRRTLFSIHLSHIHSTTTSVSHYTYSIFLLHTHITHSTFFLLLHFALSTFALHSHSFPISVLL